MSDSEVLYTTLEEVVGEEGCGMSCEKADLYMEDGRWKLKMEGFMEAWPLGSTVEEARATLKELASQQFGLS